MIWALVKDGVILEVRAEGPNVDQTLLDPGKPRLLPIVIEGFEPFDPVTQVREGPTTIIETTQVRRVFTIRAKTAAEIEEMREDLKRRLRTEGLARVGDVLPQDKQTLLMLAGFEGIINHGLDRSTWPVALRNVFNPLFTTATTTVKSIYQTLIAKQNEVDALTTPQQIAAYDVEAGW